MDFKVGDRVTLVSADHEHEYLIDLIGVPGTISSLGPNYREPAKNGRDYSVIFDNGFEGEILVWESNLTYETSGFSGDLSVDEYL